MPAYSDDSSWTSKPAHERDFEWSKTSEPHKPRNKRILAEFPEIKELMGYDPNTKYKIFAAVALQVFLAYQMRRAPWPIFFLMAWSIGGIINHGLTLAMHEVSHRLAFKSFMPNQLLGIFTSCPLGFPAYASFKRYHSDHHKYQGEDEIDCDIPTWAEIFFFRNTFTKVLWVLLQPLFYGFRPLIVLPKKPKFWEVANLAAVVVFNGSIWYFMGFKSLFYLLMSTVLGMGLHPMAGHFIAEHYTFIRGQETYSYYGPLNLFSLNVGYHNEHHDFPYIPGSRLPEVRRIAAKYYEPLPYHRSWTRVILGYIVDPLVGPYSRIKRNTLEEKLKNKIKIS